MHCSCWFMAGGALIEAACVSPVEGFSLLNLDDQWDNSCHNMQMSRSPSRSHALSSDAQTLQPLNGPGSRGYYYVGRQSLSMDRSLWLARFDGLRILLKSNDIFPGLSLLSVDVYIRGRYPPSFLLSSHDFGVLNILHVDYTIPIYFILKWSYMDAIWTAFCVLS